MDRPLSNGFKSEPILSLFWAQKDRLLFAYIIALYCIEIQSLPCIILLGAKV